MVIISNIYMVAFRSYSPFLQKCKKLHLSGSTNTKTRIYTHLEKHTLWTTQDSHGFLTMLKLFTLLYLIHLFALKSMNYVV